MPSRSGWSEAGGLVGLLRRFLVGAPPAPVASANEAATSLGRRYMADLARKSITIAQALPTTQANKPQAKEWTASEAVSGGFKSSHWVYACIKALMDTGSSVPWVVEQLQKGAEYVRVEQDHPLGVLWDRPNPFMTGQDLRQRMIAHLYLAGNSTTTKIRVGALKGGIAEMWPLNPDQIKPVPNTIDFITYYEHKVGSKTAKIAPADLLHVQFTDPANPYWGMSPMQAGEKIIETEVDSVNWWRVSLQNRVVPDGAFTFPQSLSQEQYDEAMELIRSQKMGSDNARNIMLLGNDAKFTRMSLTPAELDFIESRRMTRIDICALFRVPPPIVGIYDDATLANIQTARKIFWLDTVLPMLSDLMDAINLGLATEWGVDQVGRPLFRLRYDVSNVEALQEDLGALVDVAEKLFGMAVPFNVINERLKLGFKEFKGWDVAWIGANLLPAADAMAAPAAEESGAKGLPGGKPIDATFSVELGAVESKWEKVLSLASGRKALPPHEEREEAAEDLAEVAEELKAVGVTTEERKVRYWKAFDRRRQGHERALQGRARAVFSDEGDAVVDAFLHGEDWEAKVDSSARAWEALFLASWREMIKVFGGATATTLGGRTKKDEGEGLEEKAGAERWIFDPWTDEVQAAVRSFVARKIVRVSRTTKERVRAVVSQAFEDGLSVPQTAGLIKQIYSGFDTYRSHVIARTEVVGASNYGSRQAAIQSGAVKGRTWLSSRDDRVRGTQPSDKTNHVGMDGQHVPNMTDPYAGTLVKPMMFPGDPTGDAADVIQCRCVEVYET